MATLKVKGIEHARQAVSLDNSGDAAGALASYIRAVEFLTAAVRYEKNARAREILESQCKSYLTRAEELKLLQTQQLHQQQQPPLTATPTTSQVKWDDIAGLFEAKRLLQETVLMPRLFPHLFGPERKPWSGILLYGPPGTGKSYLAKAVATEMGSGASFFSVSSADIVSKWVGDSEKHVKELFEAARVARPSAIFVDEIDSLGRARSDSGSQNDTGSERRLLTQMLTELDGVGNSMDGILFLGATNMPWALDPALRRRFQKRIYIPLPNAAARAQLFKIHLGRLQHPLTVEDFHSLAAATEGYSGSDIQSVVREALMMPLRLIQDSTHYKNSTAGNKWTPCSPGDPDAVEMDWRTLDKDSLLEPPLTMRHFLQSVGTTRATVSARDLDAYEQWTREFGLEG